MTLEINDTQDPNAVITRFAVLDAENTVGESRSGKRSRRVLCRRPSMTRTRDLNITSRLILGHETENLSMGTSKHMQY